MVIRGEDTVVLSVNNFSERVAVKPMINVARGQTVRTLERVIKNSLKMCTDLPRMNWGLMMIYLKFYSDNL